MIRAETSNSGSPSCWHGFSVCVIPDQPKRTLPEWLVPGVVPWPPGFKQEMDSWMFSFFGVQNRLKDGEVLQILNTIHVNPRTYEHFKAALRQEGHVS